MSNNQQRLGFALMHGGGLESRVRDRVIPHLQRPSIAVHRIPPRVNRNRLTIQDCARYVGRQIFEAGLEKTILVAHSIAGVIAPAVALNAPHLVFRHPLRDRRCGLLAPKYFTGAGPRIDGR